MSAHRLGVNDSMSDGLRKWADEFVSWTKAWGTTTNAHTSGNGTSLVTTLDFFREGLEEVIRKQGVKDEAVRVTYQRRDTELETRQKAMDARGIILDAQEASLAAQEAALVAREAALAAREKYFQLRKADMEVAHVNDRLRSTREELKQAEEKVQTLSDQVRVSREELEGIQTILIKSQEEQGSDRGEEGGEKEVVTVSQRVQRLLDDNGGLTCQVAKLSRNNLEQVTSRTNWLVERREKRKKRECDESGRPSKRQRDKDRLDWETTVADLVPFLRWNMPVPDPDGSINATAAKHLIMGASIDTFTRDNLRTWWDQAADGGWYCFDRATTTSTLIHRIDAVEGRCIYHHQGPGKNEDCYQIRRAKEGQDSVEGDVVVRVRAEPTEEVEGRAA